MAVIESGDNVQIQRIAYTDSDLRIANPVVDFGVILDVYGLSTTGPANTTATNSYSTKTGYAGLAYQDLPFDDEIVYVVSGNVAFSGELEDGDTFVLYNQTSSPAYTINFGGLSPQPFVTLGPGQSVKVLKRNTIYYVVSQPENLPLEYTGTGDETCDLTTGYSVGAVVVVKNRKTSGKVNIDIDLTDNIPLGEDHSLKLWLETDGWHIDLNTEIDNYIISEQTIKKLANGDLIVNGSFFASVAITTAWGGIYFSSGEVFSFEESFALIESISFGSSRSSSALAFVGFSVPFTVNDFTLVFLRGSAGTENVSGSFFAKGLWTTQTMKG